MNWNLILAAILMPAFMWGFVYVLLWAIDDREFRQSRGGRMAPWIFTSPIVAPELLIWLMRSTS
jgi:hypothetical protein